MHGVRMMVVSVKLSSKAVFKLPAHTINGCNVGKPACYCCYCCYHYISHHPGGFVRRLIVLGPNWRPPGLINIADKEQNSSRCFE
jgi:hypothetical protein